MREIKFRGKNGDGEWVFGHYAKLSNEFKEYHCIMSEKDSKKGYIKDCNSFDMTYTAVTPDTVGQFTGLYDKNGKEIYEWDICRIEDCAKWIVEWNNEQACFSFREENGCLGSASISVFRYLTEIIGNIHDNPELKESEYDGTK